MGHKETTNVLAYSVHLTRLLDIFNMYNHASNILDLGLNKESRVQLGSKGLSPLFVDNQEQLDLSQIFSLNPAFQKLQRTIQLLVRTEPRPSSKKNRCSRIASCYLWQSDLITWCIHCWRILRVPYSLTRLSLHLRSTSDQNITQKFNLLKEWTSLDQSID